MRAAVASARAFVAAPAWGGYVLGEFGAFADAQTDAEVDAYARDNAATVDHPVGTVAMGAALDAELRVRGTSGLRVVDASTFVSRGVGAWRAGRCADERRLCSRSYPLAIPRDQRTL